MSSEETQINTLEHQVKDQYLRMERNIFYTSIKGNGELDLVGLLPDFSWDIYEVKSTNHPANIQKAQRQLKRAYFGWERRVRNTFIYIASIDEILQYCSQSSQLKKINRGNQL